MNPGSSSVDPAAADSEGADRPRPGSEAAPLGRAMPGADLRGPDLGESADADGIDETGASGTVSLARLRPPFRGSEATTPMEIDRRRRWIGIWFASGAVLTFLILVVGGITRLTQSGLSIVSWDPILGVLPPIGERAWEAAFEAYRRFPEYRVLRPDMTLEEFRFIFLWEYVHRLLARAIGIVFLVPFAIFLARGWLDRPLVRRAAVLFALGALQGFAGWFMVSSGLVDQPRVSHYRLAIHLALAFTIFGCSLWFALDMRRRPAAQVDPTARRSIRRALAAIGGLLIVQIVWGALVAGLDAGLYSDTFPLMDGALVPRAAFLWDPLVRDLLENPVTVQWIHRVLGTALALTVFVGVGWIRRLRIPDIALNRLGSALVLLVLLQYLLGVLTVVLHVPIPVAAAHQALAMILFGIWLGLVHRIVR